MCVFKCVYMFLGTCVCVFECIQLLAIVCIGRCSMYVCVCMSVCVSAPNPVIKLYIKMHTHVSYKLCTVGLYCVCKLRLCVCLCDAGDGTCLGGIQHAGEISGAAEDGAAGTHEPQRHPSGENWYCSSKQAHLQTASSGFSIKMSSFSFGWVFYAVSAAFEQFVLPDNVKSYIYLLHPFFFLLNSYISSLMGQHYFFLFRGLI